jgi:hypothetical protein
MHKRISIFAIEHPIEVIFVRTVVALLLALFLCYLYLVSSSVLNIMAQRGSASEAAHLQSEIGDMEREYFALGATLSPHEARSIGLAPLSETSYIYRPGNAALVDTADTIQPHAI